MLQTVQCMPTVCFVSVPVFHAQVLLLLGLSAVSCSQCQGVVSLTRTSNQQLAAWASLHESTSCSVKPSRQDRNVVLLCLIR